MGAPAEALFSELINHPRDTVAKLDAVHQTLLLRRRDAEDLMLTTAARAKQLHAVMNAHVRLLREMMQSTRSVGDAFSEAARKVFPWTRFLPPEDQRTFILELIETAEAATDLDTVAPIDQLITEWRNTALVYSDHDLLRAVTQESGDFGPVDEPAR